MIVMVCKPRGIVMIARPYIWDGHGFEHFCTFYLECGLESVIKLDGLAANLCRPIVTERKRRQEKSMRKEDSELEMCIR